MSPGSHHGETLGALAVTDVRLFKDTYAPLVMTSSRAESRLAARGKGESARDLPRAARRRSSSISISTTPKPRR